MPVGMNTTKEVINMTNYREILRLASIGLNRTSIGNALGYSRNTIADVFKRAQEKITRD